MSWARSPTGYSKPSSAADVFAAIYDIERASPRLGQFLAQQESQGCDSRLDVRVVGKTRRVALLCGDAGDDGRCSESLADRYWLVGRIRLDAKRTLQEKLRKQGSERTDVLSDGLLCLRAYAKWGEDFVAHLAGDFAFALWDDERQRLLVVRDQFGLRRLFHARDGAAWIVSDSLGWLARHISDRELDDYWVTDFLILAFCREAERTVYRKVDRLAPGHLLRLAAGEGSIRRYWRLSVPEPLYLRDPRDYGARFLDLVRLAIADRLPDGRVGISMSGGVDSTTLAACTVDVTGSPSRVVAECEHYAQAPHLREPHFASLAARHLGIELSLRVSDDLAYDPQWRQRGITWDEPTRASNSAHNYQVVNRRLASNASVWLWGEGPDNALQLDRDPYLGWLARNRRWRRLAGALLQYARVKGLSGWAATWHRHTNAQTPQIAYSAPPRWLNRDLVAHLRLEERDRELGEGGDRAHPWHPESMAALSGPVWQSLFDDFDFQESLAPVRWRHPFLDLRVLEFMFAVPPIPWAWKKTLVRRSMAGRLPEELLAREKTPLPIYADAVAMQKHGIPELTNRSELARYVDLQSLPTFDVEAQFEFDRALTVQAFDYWLASSPH